VGNIIAMGLLMLVGEQMKIKTNLVMCIILRSFGMVIST